VAVGEEMLSQGILTEREGIELGSTAQISGYTLSPGFFPLTGRSAQGSFYAFNFPSVGNSGFGSLSANFLMDPPQSVMVTADGSQLCVVTVFNVRVCDQEQFRPTTRLTEGDNNFQQTLLYSGRVGDRIRISYREFSGSIARPAFNNEVEYDLSVSNVIAYRGAQIRIIDANNTQITYEVLSNFNTPRQQ
ncbi:MAG: hypothetical protein K2X34_06410, partial [Hyphomonadaceae bacterium]|nr:hypothetical protein [Hyphomonadaceae bacterium]